MKILVTEHQGWHSQGGPNPIDLPLNPDKIVCDIIEENLASFDDDKTFVKMWFSKLYHDSGNNLGLVQKEINKITNNNERQDLIFLCGHIIVNMLDFGKNKVLTYHGSNLNNHTVTIPMPAFNFCEKPKDFSNRSTKASFAGSFDTHWSRRHMWYSLLGESGCLVKDTGAWHYYKDKKSQNPEYSNFKDMLGDSVMTLAPRGTGPCTIRLWEAIESLSIPIIISNEYKNPDLGIHSLSDMSIRVDECDAQNIKSVIMNLKLKDLKKKYDAITCYISNPYEARVLNVLKKELCNE